MTMSYVSQQSPAATNQTFHDVTSQKDARESTVSPTFDSRNVSAEDIGKFLGSKEYTEVLELTKEMCKKAKEVRKGDWVIRKLEAEFKKHDLPMERTGHEALKHDKEKAILNVMLGVQDEINNGNSSEPSKPTTEPNKPTLGERFCDFIRDTRSVFAGGRQVLLAEMNKAAKQAPETPPVSGDPVGADAVHKDAGMCERDIRPETVHQPYYDGKQPFSEPVSAVSAPPPYVDSQTAQAIQVERTNLQQIVFRLGQCQQGEQENQGEIEFYRNELVRINGVIQQLGSTGVELPFEFRHLQAECARAQSQLDSYKLGKCEKELRELRSSLRGIDVEAESLSQIDDLEGKLDTLSKQAESISSEKERQDLQAAIKVVVKRDIGAWRSGFAAADTLESLRLELVELKSLNSLESVESYSKRIDELKELTGSLPTGKHRTDLVIQASELEKKFMGIQDEVITQQIKDRFAEAQSKINLLPGCRDEREKLRLLEKADTSLHSASSMLEQQKSGASEGNLEQLRLLSEQVGEHKRTLQATASKMQPPVQGQGMELVASIDELIAEADNRLCGAEKMRKAVAGAALNQTHMDEIKGILDQVSEKILQVKGSDHRADRDRLQTMNATLLSRWTQLQGGGANNGQSTAASTHTATGNQNQTAVNDIRTALDEAEALVEALRSNPGSSLKDDRCTEARSSLEKATQMLGKLTDKDYKPERAALNTRLGNLNKQLNDIERGGQAQMNAVEPSPGALLQKGVAAYGDQMQAFGEGGTVSKESFQVATGNMSVLLSKFAPSGPSAPSSAGSSVGQRQTTSQTAQSRQNVSPQQLPHSSVGQNTTQNVPNRQSQSPQGVSHSPARQNTNLHAEPPKTKAVLTPGTSLASFASTLGVTKTMVHSGVFSTASMGIKPSTDRIQSLVTSSEIPLPSLPKEMQSRMIQAYAGPSGRPDSIKLVQVYAFAPNESDFKGASFQLELESLMPQLHHEIYKNSRDWEKYSPMGADLRMPEGLKQGQKFYQVNWAMNKGLAQQFVGGFAHGPGDKEHSHLQDIGFSQVAPVLVALGADTQTATSHEAGFGIPFGLDLRRQPDSVLRELQQQNTRLRSRGVEQSDGGMEADGDLQEDGDGMEGCVLDANVVTDGPRSSGINPVALKTVSNYQGSTSARASEYISHDVGILWVKTITGLPNIKNESDLLDWVESSKPDLSKLRLPQLL